LLPAKFFTKSAMLPLIWRHYFVVLRKLSTFLLSTYSMRVQRAFCSAAEIPKFRRNISGRVYCLLITAFRLLSGH